MDRRTLIDYVNEHGQTTTARRAGLSQGAIWQMLKSSREIYVIDNGDSVTLEELKRINRPATAA